MPAKFGDLFKPARYKAFYGGRGSAKSHSFATALLMQAGKEPLRVLCGREVQLSIKDSVKQLLDDKISALGMERFSVYDRLSLAEQQALLAALDALDAADEPEPALGEHKLIAMHAQRGLDVGRRLVRRPWTGPAFSAAASLVAASSAQYAARPRRSLSLYWSSAMGILMQICPVAGR